MRTRSRTFEADTIEEYIEKWEEAEKQLAMAKHPARGYSKHGFRRVPCKKCSTTYKPSLPEIQEVLESEEFECLCNSPVNGGVIY
jgi:hypothetical protein